MNLFLDEDDDNSEELSPEEELNKFLEQHPNLVNIYKMLKFGMPVYAVRQKAQMDQLNMDNINELIEKAKKVHPNIG